MTTPLSPRVLGPISAWSASVLLDGCIPGAEVTVISLARSGAGKVATGTAQAGQVRLPLIAGVKLNGKDRLVAVQAIGGETSTAVSDPLAVSVAAEPKSSGDLPHPAIATHLWEFGRGVLVQGAAPGANIVLSAPGGVLGSATADEGVARLVLSPSLPTTSAGNVQIVVEERAPPGFVLSGPPLQVVGTVNPLPIAEGAHFPTPTNPQTPLPAGCDPAVFIGGIVDGASVTLMNVRDPGQSESRIFDLSGLWWTLNRPLNAAGEKLEVTQGMGDTRRLESAPLVIAATAARSPDPPQFIPPCPGSERIGVGGLLPGANLTLQIDASDFNAGQVASDATSVDLRVPPVSAGAVITITQERCGLVASASATATELVAVGDPDIADEPIACSFRVRVLSATPGAILEIRAQRQGSSSALVRSMSGQVPVTSATMLLDVAPALSELDELWVAQLTCEAPWFEGPHHKVRPVRTLDSPTLLFPPVIDSNYVRVAGSPGAVVEVFRWVDGGVHGFLGAGAVIDPNADVVRIYRPFLAGEQVVLLQRYCNHFSRLSEPSDAAVAGKRVFALPPGQKLSFPSEGGHEVQIVASGAPAVTMTCWVDGTWSCTALALNTQSGASATFDLSFTAKDDQGVVFSKVLEGTVIPPNSGLFAPDGTPLPPSRHITWPWKPLHQPIESSFSDFATWKRILLAEGSFNIEFATWEHVPFTDDIIEDQIPSP